MIIKGVGENMIGCVVNMTINNARKYLNGANLNDVQVQFTGNLVVKTHQSLFSSWKIGIIHEEIPLLDPTTEICIGANNQLDLTISTGVLQAPKVIKSPTMDEVITITTVYNTGANRTPWGVSRTGVDGYASVTSGTRDVGGGNGNSSVYTSPHPPSSCI